MAVQRVEQRTSALCPCPRCRVNTKEVTLGDLRVRECSVCEGLWVDTVTFHKICTERERQVTLLGEASVIGSATSLPPERVRYIPCPVCQTLMNRVNFARCSNVVVDVCKPHGTWFDKDELHRIVRFINAGGMDVARLKEMEELEQQRREANAARMAATARDRQTGYGAFASGTRENAITLALGALFDSLFD